MCCITDTISLAAGVLVPRSTGVLISGDVLGWGRVIAGVALSLKDNGAFRHFLDHTRPLRTNSGCGKREAHIDWSVVITETAAPVTGHTLRTTGPVPADSRQ